MLNIFAPLGSVGVHALLVGSFILLLGLYLLINHGGATLELERHYNEIPALDWGPRWLRWQWRPTRGQSSVAAWIITSFSLASGSFSIVYGVVKLL